MVVTTKNPKRAGVYVRISEDIRDGAGVARQESEARELARRRGFHVVRVYNDNDRSASRRNIRRPEFEAMLSAMLRGELDVVIAYATDRIWRRPADLRRVIDAANRHDVAVVTVTAADVDLSTARDRMVAGILAEVSQAEVDITSERQEARHRQRRANGLDSGGPRPFGYNVDRYTINRPEAKLVREAFRRCAAGERPVDIVRDWNDRGEVTNKGRPWREANFRKMVGRIRYAGVVVDPKSGKRLGSGRWPAIVSEEVFDAANAAIAPRGPKSKRRARLLSGFLVCGRCGATLRAHGDSYSCLRDPAEYEHNGDVPKRCGALRIAASHAEAAVASAVLEVLAGDRYPNRLAADLRTRRAAVENAGESIDRRLATLHEMFLADEIDDAEYRKLRADLRRQKSANAAAAADDTASDALRVLPEIENPEAWWNDRRTTDDDRRAILRAVIDHVVVAPVGKGSAGRFDPARIVPGIVWVAGRA
jgi:site-specific DNA recombinase